MYVVYLDESGDPNGWNNNQNHFILGEWRFTKARLKA